MIWIYQTHGCAYVRGKTIIGNFNKLVCLHYTVSFSYSTSTTSKKYLEGLRVIIEICNYEVDFYKS